MADPTGEDDVGDEPAGAAGEPELGAAVDEAMRAEAKRQFVQRIVDLDRTEGGSGRETYRDE